MQNRTHSKQGQAGVVLLESLIAVLIFSIGIIGLVGLQASMLKSTTDAKHRAEAGYIAQKRISDIWTTDEANRGTLSEVDTDIAAMSGLPLGLRDTIRGAPEAGCDSAPSCYIIVVKWTPPGGTQHQYSIVTHIN